ncbi:Retrovirus-related Pol Polyprotein from transposon TNT 1-94, partial [Phytophthora megakarya]
YVPGAIANLISLDYMQSLGYFLSMAKDQSVCFLDKSEISLQFTKVDGIYRIESDKPQEQQTEIVCNAILRSHSQSLSLWHKRFAHASSETIRNMARKQTVNGLQTDNKTFEDCDCLPCIKGKKVRMTYRERRYCAKKPLQKLQVDVCTVNELTLDGCNCFLLVVDEYSRYKWIFILKQKSEAKGHKFALVNRLHVKYRENNWRIEEIHSDQGGEFDNSVLQEFSSSEGISLTMTNGYTTRKWNCRAR